jgi:hypothetical protein
MKIMTTASKARSLRFAVAVSGVVAACFTACGGEPGANDTSDQDAAASGVPARADGGARTDGSVGGHLDASLDATSVPGEGSDGGGDSAISDAGTGAHADSSQAASGDAASADATASADAAVTADAASVPIDASATIDAAPGHSACAASSSGLAWATSIAATGTLVPFDIALGPTNDVVVADIAGGNTLEQHRWDETGTVVSVHQDPAGSYVGPILPSSIVIDAANDVYYGFLLTGMPQAANLVAALNFERITPSGAAVYIWTSTNALPATSGPAAVSIFTANFDMGTNTHSPLLMSGPQYFAPGVYCWSPTGANLGVSAANVLTGLSSQDAVWPASDGGLYVAMAVTASVNLGCGMLTVPAAGGIVLGKFTGGGSCTWNRLLSLPTAAVKARSFRIGADGSLLFASVFSGTINFGGAALTSVGTNSLAMARFDATGDLLSQSMFGGAGSSFTLGSLAGNATGDVVLTAGYAGSVNLGGGTLAATDDTFIAVFDATGAYKWSRVVDVGSTGRLIASVGACGVALATSSPTVNLGSGPLSTASAIGVAALGL